MVSILTCKAFLYPVPNKCGPCSPRKVSRNTQSRQCPNSPGWASYLKAGSIVQSWSTGFEAWSRARSMRQVIKAGEAETPVQHETAQEEVKEKDETPSKTDEKPGDVTEAMKVVEEGGAVGKYWVLCSASEGDGMRQEIVGGDGLLVGAAPNATGSSKPFVVDHPMVSGSHARVYGKERKTYRTTVQEYFVRDLGSTNGTYLNRSKLRPNMEVKLTCGDTLKFGDERATFIVEAQD